MNYKDISKVKYIHYIRQIDDEEVRIPIEIQGIVSSLPDNRDMIVGKDLFQSFEDEDFYRELILGDSSNSGLHLYVENIEIQKMLEDLNDTDTKVEVESNSKDGIGKKYKIRSTITKKGNLLNKIINKEGVLRLYDFYSASLEIEDVASDLDKEKLIFEFFDKVLM